MVLKLGRADYRMWAYGREVGFDSHYSNSSFGRSGYFTSTDGKKWTPRLGKKGSQRLDFCPGGGRSGTDCILAGQGVLGSVLDPRNGTTYFDAGALGITDVKLVHGFFYAWYMGLSDAKLVNSTAVRAGIAVSEDGLQWHRCDGPQSSLGFARLGPWVFGPHISEFSPSPLSPQSSNVCLPVSGNFSLLYHAPAPGNVLRLQEMTAHANNLLDFHKTGPLQGVAPSADESSFDYHAAADGRVIKVGTEYLYFYEGLDINFNFSLGLARSTDGVTFAKDTSCTGEPGGPIFSASTDPEAFDSLAVGTPFPLLQPSGEIWLYYVGFDGRSQGGAGEGNLFCQVGLAISQPNDEGIQDYCSFARVEHQS